MPNLTLKEAIEIVADLIKSAKERTAIGSQVAMGHSRRIEALSLAISKLELFLQVEEGGVKKICEFHKDNLREDDCDYCFYNRIFNEAIDLCNALWAKRLEGIEKVIQNAILYYQVNEASISCQYLKDNPKSLIDCLAQAIIMYLSKKEKE